MAIPTFSFQKGRSGTTGLGGSILHQGHLLACEQSGDLILVICDLASLLYGTSFVFTQLELDCCLQIRTETFWPEVML